MKTNQLSGTAKIISSFQTEYDWQQSVKKKKAVIKSMLLKNLLHTNMILLKSTDTNNAVLF